MSRTAPPRGLQSPAQSPAENVQSLKGSNGNDGDVERLERERRFHNQRFADDALRRDRVGRFYEAAATLYAKYKERILRSPAGVRVLELGVGGGGQAYALAEHGASVTGIDISETAVAVARQKSISRGIQINFQVMNAEQTSFKDQSFDLVCGSGILHHLDLRKAIPEIRRLLRPGGCAVFVEPLGHNVLINLFRRMTPSLRSSDEHPLLKDDLRFMDSHFEDSRIEYFGLMSVAAASLARPLRRSLGLRRLLEAVDRCLFTVPWLRLQAWSVLIELTRKPRIED